MHKPKAQGLLTTAAFARSAFAPWLCLLPRVKSLALSDLSTLLWALAQLELQPPDDILADLCDCAAPHIPACGVEDLTNIVWALARIHARPGKPWVETAESASLQVKWG